METGDAMGPRNAYLTAHVGETHIQGEKTEQVEYSRKRTRAMIKCTNKGISEVKHLKDR